MWIVKVGDAGWSVLGEDARLLYVPDDLWAAIEDREPDPDVVEESVEQAGGDPERVKWLELETVLRNGYKLGDYEENE